MFLAIWIWHIKHGQAQRPTDNLYRCDFDTQNNLGLKDNFDLKYMQQAIVAVGTTPIFTNKRIHQKHAVRQLLHNLLTHHLSYNNQPITYLLNQTDFPFYITINHNRYFVCFSHSQDDKQTYVSLILSKKIASVDTECRNITWHTAQRFFHHHEIKRLTHKNPEQQRQFIKILWQIKESMIKITSSTLVTGLGKDFSDILDILSDSQLQTSTFQTAVHFDNQSYQLIIHRLFVVLIAKD